MDSKKTFGAFASAAVLVALLSQYQNCGGSRTESGRTPNSSGNISSPSIAGQSLTCNISFSSGGPIPPQVPSTAIDPGTDINTQTRNFSQTCGAAVSNAETVFCQNSANSGKSVSGSYTIEEVMGDGNPSSVASASASTVCPTVQPPPPSQWPATVTCSFSGTRYRANGGTDSDYLPFSSSTSVGDASALEGQRGLCSQSFNDAAIAGCLPNTSSFSLSGTFTVQYSDGSSGPPTALGTNLGCGSHVIYDSNFDQNLPGHFICVGATCSSSSHSGDPSFTINIPGGWFVDSVSFDAVGLHNYSPTLRPPSFSAGLDTVSLQSSTRARWNSGGYSPFGPYHPDVVGNQLIFTRTGSGVLFRNVLIMGH